MTKRSSLHPFLFIDLRGDAEPQGAKKRRRSEGDSCREVVVIPRESSGARAESPATKDYAGFEVDSDDRRLSGEFPGA